MTTTMTPQGLKNESNNSVFLFVVDPPRITHKPNSTSVIQGTEVTINCRAEANPSPEYEWYKVRSSCSVSGVRLSIDEGGCNVSPTAPV